MNEPTFEQNIPQMSSNKLCEIIVANRYLGVMRDEAIMCMEELAKRRTAGDGFEYEKHIDLLMQSLPKIRLDMAKIMKVPGLF